MLCAASSEYTMSDIQKINGICIGVGVRGKSWCQWAQDAGVNVVGVVDINETLLNKVCDELEVPEAMRFTSIADAASQTDATVATVCTSNSTHVACLNQCMDAGLHAMVEKPMAETPAEARTLLAKSHETGCRVAVAQNYRYCPGIIAMRNVIRDGLIGDVFTIHVRFARWRPAPGFTLPLLLNQAIHHLDSVRFLLDCDWSWCFATSRIADWSPTDGPSLLSAIWRFEDGHPIDFSYDGTYVTRGQQTPFSGQWWIEGTKGRIEFTGDLHPSVPELSLIDDEMTRPIDIVDPGIGEPALVFRDFLAGLRTGEPAPTEIDDNVKSLGMCWAAQLSSDEQRVVQPHEVVPA